MNRRQERAESWPRALLFIGEPWSAFLQDLTGFTGASVIKELSSRKSNDPKKTIQRENEPPPRRGGMPRWIDRV